LCTKAVKALSTAAASSPTRPRNTASSDRRVSGSIPDEVPHVGAVVDLEHQLRQLLQLDLLHGLPSRIARSVGFSAKWLFSTDSTRRRYSTSSRPSRLGM
jgi:hypothetical protein